MTKGGRESAPGFEQGKRAAIALLTKEKQALPPYAQGVVVNLIKKIEGLSDQRTEHFR